MKNLMDSIARYKEMKERLNNKKDEANQILSSGGDIDHMQKEIRGMTNALNYRKVAIADIILELEQAGVKSISLVETNMVIEVSYTYSDPELDVEDVWTHIAYVTTPELAKEEMLNMFEFMVGEDVSFQFYEDVVDGLSLPRIVTDDFFFDCSVISVRQS